MAEKVRTVRDVAEKVIGEDEYSFGPGMFDLLPKQLMDKVLTGEYLYEIMEEISLLCFTKERILLRAAFNYRPEKMEDFPQDMRDNLDELIRNENHHRTPDWKRYKLQEIRFLATLGARILKPNQ